MCVWGFSATKSVTPRTTGPLQVQLLSLVAAQRLLLVPFDWRKWGSDAAVLHVQQRSVDARGAGDQKSHDSAIGLRRNLANGSELELKACCFPCGLAGLEAQSAGCRGGDGEGVTWETFRPACCSNAAFLI